MTDETEQKKYDNKPDESRVDHAGNAKVQRVVWEDGAYIFKTEWMSHFEIVRELYEEKRKAMPGANVRMKIANVKTVTDIRDMDFNEDNND